MKTKLFFTVLLFITLSAPVAKTYAAIDTIRVYSNTMVFTPDSMNIHLGDVVVFAYYYVGGNYLHTTQADAVPTGATKWGKTQLDSVHRYFSYTPPVQGMYAYECTFHAGMGMVGKFIVGPSLSVNNVVKPAITVSPNPASTEIKVQANDPDASLKLFDLAGKLVGQLQVRSRTGNDLYFDISSVPGGMYMLQITANNTVSSQKLLIQR